MKKSYELMLRMGAYALLSVCFAGVLNYIAGLENPSHFKEGAVEWLQVLLLAISAAICFWIAARRSLSAKTAPAIAALIIIIAILREFDRLLNYYIPFGGWKLPVLCLVVFVFVLFVYKRKQLLSELHWIVLTPFFSLMWAGLVVVIYGQLVGHGEFLEPLLQADYVRDHKRIMEECFEMLGYLLIFFGAIEFWFDAKD